MPNKKAVIETARGTIEAELFADEVPTTVANFEKLANSSYYDGTTFHRVIRNFMIQGGDPYSRTGQAPVGTGGPGYTIKRETQRNTHKHIAGTLSMAHRDEVELAGRGFTPEVEQQYMSKNPNLDFSHVDSIEKTEIDPAELEALVAEGGLQ